MDILNYLHSMYLYITVDNLLIGTCVFGLLVVFGIIAIKVLKKLFKNKVRIAKLNINIGSIGNISIELDKEVIKVAHKTWVEIMTRKIGILFEEDYDVIVEVYNSWYQMFGIVRDLLKNIEPNKKDKNLEKLENILIEILNNGLRPHLTKWQAKFRRWYNYEIEKKENSNISPQDIQKNFPEYNELVKDLKDTNILMVRFAQELRKLF